MQTIPLARGDLSWIFPDLGGPAVVEQLLVEVDSQVRRLAVRLGVPSAGPGGGLRFHRAEQFGFAGLEGRVEVGSVAFTLAMGAQRGCLWDVSAGPPWSVEASVDVTCDRGLDCGLHVVEQWDGHYDTPVGAVQGLLAAAVWLAERAAAAPVESWSGRATRCTD